MDSEEFETRARGLAEGRGYVTAASLAEALGLPEGEAKERLQAMYDSGALELDLEGDDFVYRLKGRVKGTPAAAPLATESAPAEEKAPPVRIAEPEPDEGSSEDDEAEDSGPGIAEQLKDATTALVKDGQTAVKEAALGSLVDDPGAAPVDEDDRKKLLYGIGLGALFPGVGLFYAAPMISASVATAVVLLVLGILQAIPVLGTILSLYVFGAFMLVSGLLGGLYTHRYNKTGRRTRLLRGGEGIKALPF